jgi:hypothetical protein
MVIAHPKQRDSSGKRHQDTHGPAPLVNHGHKHHEQIGDDQHYQHSAQHCAKNVKKDVHLRLSPIRLVRPYAEMLPHVIAIKGK